MVKVTGHYELPEYVPLTMKGIELLRYASMDYPSKQISDLMGIPVETVNTMKKRLMKNLHAHGNGQLAYILMDLKITSTPEVFQYFKPTIPLHRQHHPAEYWLKRDHIVFLKNHTILYPDNSPTKKEKWTTLLNLFKLMLVFFFSI
jgi:DNA-binding CsgD family transcriptional regulator